MKPKIILDTDPGGDDSFALLWLISLVKQGWAELVAVTSVDGNVHARLTFAAASQLLKLCNLDAIDVGRGVIGGSAGDIQDAAAIHGTDGMGNLSQTLPVASHTYESAQYADDMLIEALRASPGEITLIAIAPLTNLAAAEKRAPGILSYAKEIVIMGGAFAAPGNITAEAEFNIAYDSEAAAIVFDRCTNLVVIPLDITQHLVFTNAMAADIAARSPEHPIAQFVVNLCAFMVRTAMAFRETGGRPGFLVHDAATLAYVFYPETLRFRRAHVQIETQGKWTRGKTVLDNRHHPKTLTNAWVATEVDSSAMLAVMSEDLKRLIQFG